MYQHDCAGASDIRERQGHYIRAQSEEEAWQIMATRYPEESTLGFTVEEWAGGNVTEQFAIRNSQFAIRN